MQDHAKSKSRKGVYLTKGLDLLFYVSQIELDGYHKMDHLLPKYGLKMFMFSRKETKVLILCACPLGRVSARMRD